MSVVIVDRYTNDVARCTSLSLSLSSLMLAIDDVLMVLFVTFWGIFYFLQASFIQELLNSNGKTSSCSCSSPVPVQFISTQGNSQIFFD